MFLYEMQRHSEVEALFKAQMFRLARAEDASNATGARLGKVEDDVKDVKKQVTSQEVEERLATSRVRFNAQQTKIDACDQKLELRTYTNGWKPWRPSGTSHSPKGLAERLFADP